VSNQNRGRPARMAATYVKRGDIVMEAPSDGGHIIGTVTGVHGNPTDGYWFTVKTRTEEINWPRHPRRPVASERPVWVHVPTGSVS
jgi:hypothetical protein